MRIFNTSRAYAILVIFLALSIIPTSATPIPQDHMTKISALVRHVLKANKLDSISPLSGGFSSPGLYKITIKCASYVIRFGNTTDKACDAKREINAMTISAARDLAPKVLYSDVRNAIILMEFRERTTVPRDQLTNNIIKNIGLSLQRLHDGPSFQETPSIFEDIDITVSKLDDPFKGKSLPIIKQALLLKNKLFVDLKDSLTQKPCHNDVHPENILIVKDKIYLIDWELAGQGDPFRDLASFSMFSNMNEKQELHFLTIYLGHKPLEKEILKLKKMKQVVMIHFGLKMIWIGQAAGMVPLNSEQLAQLPDFASYPRDETFMKDTRSIFLFGFVLLQEALKLSLINRVVK